MDAEANGPKRLGLVCPRMFRYRSLRVACLSVVFSFMTVSHILGISLLTRLPLAAEFFHTGDWCMHRPHGSVQPVSIDQCAEVVG